jgi:hypothetical protein
LNPIRPHVDADLAAPKLSGERLVKPSLKEAGAWAASNRQLIDAADCDIQGRSLKELAAAGRSEIAAAAWKYTRDYRSAVEPPSAPSRVFLAGHQPELFHPGVWLKNFALGRLAEMHGGVAVNLVIDSDTIKSSSLRVPAGSVERPMVDGVLFDRPSEEIPFRQRPILDRTLFESFGRRAAERIAPLVADPLLLQFWPLAIEAARRTANLGECLAQSRHQFEERWGLATLELPQSHVCCLPSFRWLMAHLLANLPRLWEVYNSALAEYRRQHHVRSTAHPAPDLAADGIWLEAPFWIWTEENPHRRRVFVSSRGDELILADLEGLEAPLSLSAEGEAGRAVEQLCDLERRGIHLRTRALITTLAARLIFGDLFIHGIGGAKYDRLTDAIICRFFGIEPPAYMVVSGTLRLPIEREPASLAELRKVQSQLRELDFHPERYLNGQPTGDAGDDDSAAHWIAVKETRIAAPFAPLEARARCRAIRAANEHLQPFIAAERAELTMRLASLQRALRAEAILSSREYSFCLHPEQNLRQFLLGL